MFQESKRNVTIRITSVVVISLKKPVRVTFDGNLLHLAEGLLMKVLPIYYTVIAWDSTDIFKNLLARKYFIVVQLRSTFFGVKLLQK